MPSGGRAEIEIIENNGTTWWHWLAFYICTQNFCTESVSLVQAHIVWDLSFLMVYQSWWLFSGEECQREDIEGKLHILMGTIAVSKIPGNPNICSGCFHKSTEFFNMWQKATIGISEYIEVQYLSFNPRIPSAEQKI